MRYLYHLVNKLLGNFRYDYDSLWDKKLNEILSDFEIDDVEEEDFVTFKSKGHFYKISLRNYPYNSYVLEEIDGIRVCSFQMYRPSIRTMVKFDKLILEPIMQIYSRHKAQSIKDLYS